mmetsp:Transcript_30253/g.87211  ORF Transcript_30253/g.87211 Transcript_30253/m.87211 type:complete len:248 (-) Transcript_30253:522-1265(-)
MLRVGELTQDAMCCVAQIVQSTPTCKAAAQARCVLQTRPSLSHHGIAPKWANDEALLGLMKLVLQRMIQLAPTRPRAVQDRHRHLHLFQRQPQAPDDCHRSSNSSHQLVREAAGGDRRRQDVRQDEHIFVDSGRPRHQQQLLHSALHPWQRSMPLCGPEGANVLELVAQAVRPLLELGAQLSQHFELQRVRADQASELQHDKHAEADAVTDTGGLNPRHGLPSSPNLIQASHGLGRAGTRCMDLLHA